MDNKEVLQNLEKLKSFFTGDITEALRASGYDFLRKDHIEDAIDKTKIAEEFGIPVKTLVGYGAWYDVQIYDGFYGSRYLGIPNDISWEDEGKELEDGEWLYIVGFPTGAYSLHKDYPTKTFNKMFAELKAFGAKYCDTANKQLYFTKDVAKLVHESCADIYKKHADQVKYELEEKRTEALEAELKKLKGE